MYISVIVVAAGKGRRMKTSTPKQYLKLGEKTVLEYVLEFWQGYSFAGEIVLVLPPQDREKTGNYLQSLYPKITAIASGGNERPASVLAGLQRVSNAAEYVAVHDGVRPVLSEEMLERILAKLSQYSCVIPVINVKDTLKEVNREGIVQKTLPRGMVRAVQTPQFFEKKLLEKALESASGAPATDEAFLVEEMGGAVCTVRGDERNIKITTLNDLVVARAFLEEMKK